MYLLILILVLLDQGSKIFMSTFFENIDIRVFNNNVLGLSVFLNRNVSVFNNDFLDLNLSMELLTLLNMLLLLLLVSIYHYFKFIQITKKSYYIVLLLFISAAICSTIDRVFWGGSLDFIVFLGYIIDFKDIYLGLGAIITIGCIIKDVDFKASMKDDFEPVKKYLLFIKDSISKRFFS